MAYKYVNPGYLELVPNTSNMQFAQSVSGDQYNVNNAIAFTGRLRDVVNAQERTFIPIPDGAAEIWFNFDMWLDTDADSTTMFSLFNGTAEAGVTFVNHTSADQAEIRTFTSYEGATSQWVVLSDGIFAGLHRYSIRFKIGPATGAVVVYMDGKIISEFYGYTNSLAVTSGAGLYFRVGDTAGLGSTIANIIVSDTVLGPMETVKIMPIASVSSEWTDNLDGTYTVDVGEKKLMFAPDVTALTAAIGDKNSYTGVAHAVIDLAVAGDVKSLQSAYQAGAAAVITGDSIVLDSSKMAQELSAVSKNPTTDTDWAPDNIEGMQMGFISKTA